MSDTSTLRARWLGGKLAEWLRRRGVPVRVAARQLDTDTDVVARLLAGDHTSPVEVAGILALCGVTGPDRDTALEIATNIAEEPTTRSWFEITRRRPPGWDVVAHAERTAQRITMFHPLLVPDLAQLAGYTHDITATAPTVPTPPARAAARTVRRQGPARVIERHVRDVQNRQVVLRGFRPPSARFLIPRRALRPFPRTDHLPADERVAMAQQVRHLTTLSQLPHIDVHVLPDHTGPVTTGEPFTLFEFPHHPPAVCLPHPDHLAVLEEPDTVHDYQQLVSALLDTAHPMNGQ